MQGIQGPQGEKGSNFIPSVESVETLEPNTPATASARTDGDNLYFSFGIPQGIPGYGTKLSDFENDVGFVTPDTTDLENYIVKDSTYTQTEVNNLLSTKANTSDVNTALATKANTSDVTTSLATKVNVSDVVDNLTSTETAKPLSAKQGKNLKEMIDFSSKNLVCNLHYRDCSEWIDGITLESASSPIKGYFQGMTTTDDSIIFAIQAGGSFENKLNNVYLVEISKSTGNTIREAFLQLYHANSLAYNDSAKEIYVACNSYVNENDEIVNFNKIIIVDYETFTIKGDAVISNDVLNNIGNYAIMSVSYDNKNNVLGIGTSQKFFIMEDFETVIQEININYDNTAPHINPIFNHATNQQIKLFDGKLYQTRLFGNGLVVYDLNGNVLKNYYDFVYELPLKIGEFESIEIEDNGDVYIATVQRSWTSYKTYSLFDRTIFKTNLKYNGYKNYKKTSNSNTTGNQYYVDSTTTNHLQIGTQDFPFKCINQAILTIQEAEDLSSYIYCNNLSNGIIINRCNKYISIDGVQNYQILGIVAEGCNMAIVNSKIDLSHDLQISNDNKNIQIYYSNVAFKGTTFTAEDSNEKIENCINVYFSKIKISNSTFNNFTNCIRSILYTDITFGTSNNTLVNCDYKYYNENQMVNIHGNSRYIFSESNPNGVLPSKVNKAQVIGYTHANNLLTFNNTTVKDYISVLSFAYDVKIGSTTIGLSDTFRMSNSRLTHIVYVSSNYYIIDLKVNFTDNSTKMQITPKVTQTDFNGNTSDVTSTCTFSWYGLFAIL